MIGNGRTEKDGARGLNTGRGASCTRLNVQATLEGGDVQGRGAGQDPEGRGPEPGSATVRGRALHLRVISPASVSPGVRG